jgi:phosphoglucosamine mutase
MTRKLFGTDGVRGVAGELLSAELALGLAQAATRLAQAERPQVLIVRDTRESGEMLQAAVAAGVAAAGGEALLGGVLPTPAAPLLIARYGFDLAAVLSASHNPYEDNGIKFFGADGYKLSDETELQIERELEQASEGRAGLGGNDAVGQAARGGPPTIGRIRELRGAGEDYLRELHTRFAGLDLSGLDVLLDCANGATYRVAPEIFRRLGANVTAVAGRPDGRNINADCGSTHIARLAGQVVADGHALGFAFDGDGDRVLAVDGAGAVVDGDELMALAALHLRDAGRLHGGGVVVTVMTNYGFHTAMAGAEVEVASTQVGDRYVLAELLERGWTLGGEQSGHLIELGFNRTGDGIAGALLTLEALAGGDLRERGAMAKLPQRLVNVRVRDREALHGADVVTAAVRAEDETLAGRGRVLVRPSGTEPLVRVMVEAPTDTEAQEVCDRLVAVVQRELA